MSFAGCHDTLVVIVFHVVLQDLLEPVNGVWGIEKWSMEERAYGGMEIQLTVQPSHTGRVFQT